MLPFLGKHSTIWFHHKLWQIRQILESKTLLGYGVKRVSDTDAGLMTPRLILPLTMGHSH
jgi:hypothetical protein